MLSGIIWVSWNAVLLGALQDATGVSIWAFRSHANPRLSSARDVQDMLSVVVTLNRCMYAQLEQQEFEAPSGFSMPPAKSPQHSVAQRGMKLSCGFEMLYARSSAAEVHPLEPRNITTPFGCSDLFHDSMVSPPCSP